MERQYPKLFREKDQYDTAMCRECIRHQQIGKEEEDLEQEIKL